MVGRSISNLSDLRWHIYRFVPRSDIEAIDRPTVLYIVPNSKKICRVKNLADLSENAFGCFYIWQIAPIELCRNRWLKINDRTIYFQIRQLCLVTKQFGCPLWAITSTASEKWRIRRTLRHRASGLPSHSRCWAQVASRNRSPALSPSRVRHACTQVLPIAGTSGM